MEIPKTLLTLAWRLQRRMAPRARPYHLLLSIEEEGGQTLDGYKALVRLLRSHYFSTIVVTHPCPLLEYTLRDLHPRPFIYGIGQGQDEQIINALDGQAEGICIIKLYNSYPHSISHQESPRHRQIVRMTPLPLELQHSLERYLNQDIVIVGSIAQNHQVLRAFHQQPGGGIYYVLPVALPGGNDPMLAVMQQQGRALDSLLITGAYGEFAAFFQALEEQINTNIQGVSYTVSSIAEIVAIQPFSLPGSAGSEGKAAVQCIDASPPQSQQAINLSPPVGTQTKRPVRSASGQKKTVADVLLVTITSIEAEAVLHQFPDARLEVIQDKTYYNLGQIKKARIFMVQSPRMGASGSGGARATIEKGIQALNPWAVIMVGIAFGFDEEKQQIGDVLVSQQLLDYEAQRIGSGPQNQQHITARGDRVSASDRLLDRFVAGQHTLRIEWQEAPTIRFGLLLSGAKLVDNKVYRDQLHALAPEAIGGEMEGTALLEAAHGKVDWLLIKAICDWADGQKNVQKDERQILAAENAARFTAHVLWQSSFARPRRQKRP